MKTKQRTVRKKKRYGPNIVRAWFDTVFQYALRGLENERSFLVRQNWTFHFRTGTLEYLGPLAQHLPAAARENLEQFVFFFPDVGGRINAHDGHARELEESCSAYFDALLKSSHFRDVYQSIAEEAHPTVGGDFHTHFGAYSSETDFYGDSRGILGQQCGKFAQPLHHGEAVEPLPYPLSSSHLDTRTGLFRREDGTNRSGHARSGG
jgi:hypothetical protein